MKNTQILWIFYGVFFILTFVYWESWKSIIFILGMVVSASFGLFTKEREVKGK